MEHTAQDVFNAMQAQFRPEKAQGVNTTIQFDLSGEGGGTWTVRIANGQCEVHPGADPNPNATIMASAADYIAIASNRLNPMQAMAQGRLKVKGDITAIMRLQQLFTFR